MKLQHATWPQVKEYFEHSDTVIIGSGSCENHGTHLPLGTDTLIPEKILALIEEKIPVLCTPVIPFGSCDYFTQYPGTVSLGNELLRSILWKVAESLYQAGARHFIYLNGHGGNISAIEDVCYEMSKRGALSAVMNWWMMAGSFDPSWTGGHGGGQETAAILYANPGWVDRGAMKPGDITDVGEQIKAVTLKIAEFKGVQVTIPRQVGEICANGWVGPDDIFRATPEWGENMLTTIADYIVDFIGSFKEAPINDISRL